MCRKQAYILTEEAQAALAASDEELCTILPDDLPD